MFFFFFNVLHKVLTIKFKNSTTKYYFLIVVFYHLNDSSLYLSLNLYTKKIKILPKNMYHFQMLTFNKIQKIKSSHIIKAHTHK